MAEKIQVWTIDSATAQPLARPLDELRSTETEQRLEEILVTSPSVLMPELTLVGRQVPTGGGPLDLLGVDEDGRLVLFELKRGTLTRDAVAQILDYGSDLRDREPEDLAGLIEQHSGRLGIEKIEDFADWYRSEFPDVDELPPTGLRLVLVGLGVDDRARRMVSYLSQAGVDIQLLTFQAFSGGASGTLLARHMESAEPSGRDKSSPGGTKVGNQKLLEELAERAGVQTLYFEIAQLIASKLPGYQWPGKSGYSYSLQELTDKGRPSLRAYAWLGLGPANSRRVLLQLPDRALDAAPEIEAVTAEWKGLRRNVSRWVPFELTISPENWPALRVGVADVLEKIAAGWKEKVTRQKDTNESAAAQNG